MINFTQGSDISDCGQYEVGPGDTPVRRSITLHDHDSINLTTGVVTRTARTGEYMPGHRRGLRANDPVSLHSAFVTLALRGKITMSIETQGYADRVLSN